MTTTALESSPRKAGQEVAPALLEIIRSASTPVAVPPDVPVPASVPGPRGHVAGLRTLLDLMRRGVDASLDYRARYGDVYTFTLGGTPMVGIWDADAVHRILRNDDRAWSTAMGWMKFMFEGLDETRGNIGGLLAVDFDDHRLARKLVTPAFTTKAIDGYLLTARRLFAETNAAWVQRGHVDFKREGRTLLSRVAGEIFTGIRDPERMAVVDRALADFWNVQFALSRRAWLSPTFRRARRGFWKLLEILAELAPERRANGGEDLFSLLCNAPERDGLGDEDVVRIFVNILAAAFDTTSAGLASMAYLVAKHPVWQERLRAEAMAIGDRPVDVAAAREMKDHDLVWKETLRLFPVAAFLPRKTLREVEVCGHRLAPGTLALFASGAMGRHPAWWNEPDRFDPERFSPERAEDRKHPAISNPFGGGAHVCIGMQLATMEVKAFWHDLLRRCRIRLAPDYEGHSVATPLGTISGDVRLALEPL